MTFDPTSVEVLCVTLPKDHCVQVPWIYIKVCGYSDIFAKKLNQRLLTLRWPLTPHLLRSHVWLYPRIIVSKSHGNTSMYVDTVINFAKILQITTYIHILHTTFIIHTYYIQNQWSHSLFLNYVQARQKNCLPKHAQMRCDLGKPATCHIGQFCRNKQNNLKILTFFFIFYQLW